jgi:SpoVK/Ycf46/Vps4 family AAA+-type ATPase
MISGKNSLKAFKTRQKKLRPCFSGHSLSSKWCRKSLLIEVIRMAMTQEERDEEREYEEQYYREQEEEEQRLAAEDEAKNKFRISVLTAIKNGGKVSQADAEEYYKLTGEEISKNAIAEDQAKIEEDNKTIEEYKNRKKPEPLIKEIVGNDKIVRLIKEDITLLEKGFSRVKGRILTGPSGYGKSHIIKYIKAGLSSKWEYIKIKNQWDGEHNEVIDKITLSFAKMAKNPKTLYFLDIPECESIMMSRNDTGSGKTKTQRAITKTLLDEISEYEVDNLYMICTTNKPAYIDSGFTENPARIPPAYELEDYSWNDWKALCKMYLPQLKDTEHLAIVTKIYHINNGENVYARKWTPGNLKQMAKGIEADKILTSLDGIDRTMDILKRFDEINDAKKKVHKNYVAQIEDTVKKGKQKE